MALEKRKHFASINEFGVVDNCSVINYTDSLMEYSCDDQSITKNQASIGSTYDSNLNAFIPPKPDPTYIFNTEIFVWEPDPTLEYIADNGIKQKWNAETKEWYAVNPDEIPINEMKIDPENLKLPSL